MPLSHKELGEFVVNFFGVKPKQSWASKWISSRPNYFKLNRGKLLAKKRTCISVMEEIKQFCKVMISNFKIFKMNSWNCINYDETRLVINENGPLKVFCKHQENINYLGMNYKCLGSYVPFVAANGLVILSVFIFPSKKGKETGLVDLEMTVPEENIITRSSWRRYYAFTETGYLDRTTFRIIMREFCLIWKNLYENLHCYVFGDQLNVHIDPNIIAECRNNNVFLMYLPANTSHFLQPLDNICFSDFKKKLRVFSENPLKKDYIENVKV